MGYGLYQALLLILEKGLEKVYQRHMANHLALVKGLEALGLTMLVDAPYRLPVLNAVDRERRPSPRSTERRAQKVRPVPLLELV